MKQDGPPDRRPMLEAINLTKRYEDGLLALDQVSFSVFPGQIYAMLGANGAGKTTTINLFLNFIEPTEGEAPFSRPSRAQRRVTAMAVDLRAPAQSSLARAGRSSP